MDTENSLRFAIQAFLENNPLAELKKGSNELSESYRHRQKGTVPFLDTDSQRKAYLLCRMPATFAAVRDVLRELCTRMPEVIFKQLLDLGSGPGTTLWAALEEISSLEMTTLIEKDEHMVALGKKLINFTDRRLMTEAAWKLVDLTKAEAFVPHDLVVMSYSLGELDRQDQISLLHKAWKAASKAIVIVEPGTPSGFENIRHARDLLLNSGAHMVAPCPHANACPMAGGNWCHFSVRLERTKDHRQAKGGTLGYEDEKYSYIILAKDPMLLPKSRVLRHPLKRSGHVVLDLCTPDGLKQETISKRHKEEYKIARKLEWGGCF